ncbi:MAG: AAA family ATPase, partial [Isosphaeraceae bacterium]
MAGAFVPPGNQRISTLDPDPSLAYNVLAQESCAAMTTRLFSEVAMLVRLFGKNFRSLKDDFELSMVAADLKRKEDRDRGVIEVPIAGSDEPLRLLRTVAIYGPNASGKSTVLMAARALSWLAIESSAQSQPDAKIPPYEPFALDEESSKSPIELGCDVTFKESILRYQISYESKSIWREFLVELGGDGETLLLERSPSGEVTGDLIARSDANRLYVEKMQPNVSVLSKLAQHGPHSGKESVGPYYRAIRDATRYLDYSGAAVFHLGLGYTSNERFAKDDLYREWIMDHLIKDADFGICDVRTRLAKVELPEALRVTGGKAPDVPNMLTLVSFVHEGDARQPIEFWLESSGTKKLFNIAGDWWTIAHEEVTLLADELSASLHPRLLNGLIRAVNEPAENLRSQLIFATHDTVLLESQDGEPPALRRDQVYFTKKKPNGATELYSLAEFKEGARPVHNIRKRYMSG